MRLAPFVVVSCLAACANQPQTRGEARTPYRAGNAHVAQKDYKAAIEDYGQAIAVDPTFTAAYNNRGLARTEIADYDGAIADFTAALRYEPENSGFRYNRGRAYAGKQATAQALNDFDEAIRLKPDYASAYSDRGLLRLERKDYAAALRDYNEAVRLDPKPPRLLSRAVLYTLMNQPDKALADYDAVIRQQPAYAPAYTGRAATYRTMGDTARAQADEAKAKELAGK